MGGMFLLAVTFYDFGFMCFVVLGCTVGCEKLVSPGRSIE